MFDFYFWNWTTIILNISKYIFSLSMTLKGFKTLKMFITCGWHETFQKYWDFEDSSNLQTDLDNFYLWCNKNGMSLNIQTFSIISFSLKKQL